MRLRFTGLWRHSEFMKLWTAQTVSVFGTMITHLALPLTAVLTLNASPAQMGILGAVEFAPFLLIGLFAGVWVDRMRRRPILIAADIGRALLLGSIPLMAALGRTFLKPCISFILKKECLCTHYSPPARSAAARSMPCAWSAANATPRSKGSSRSAGLAG